jgi:hypothetical protein
LTPHYHFIRPAQKNTTTAVAAKSNVPADPSQCRVKPEWNGQGAVTDHTCQTWFCAIEQNLAHCNTYCVCDGSVTDPQGPRVCAALSDIAIVIIIGTGAVDSRNLNRRARHHARGLKIADASSGGQVIIKIVAVPSDLEMS